MKFTYAYKTGDGMRHEAAMDAPSREVVFAELRKKGIKAIKVVAADGSKANGEVRGIRKRVAAAGALCLVLGAVAAAVIAFKAGDARAAKHETRSTMSPRHQIYGDPATVEDFEHGKLDAYLPRCGDRLLAYFAQPGKVCCPKDVQLAGLRRLDDGQVAALEAVAGSDVEIADADPREVRELKQMVNGIREEMRGYLANGNGTVRSFWRRLMERTRQETQIYERIRRELEHETDPAVWEEKNDALRCLGLRTIPNPQSDARTQQ